MMSERKSSNLILGVCLGIFGTLFAIGFSLNQAAKAAPSNNTPFYTAGIGSPPSTSLNITASGTTTVWTDPGNGSVIKGVNVYSTCTSTVTLTVNYVSHNGTTTIPLFQYTLPANAGSTSVAPAGILSRGVWANVPIDSNGNPSLQFGYGDSLSITAGAIANGNVSVCILNPETF